MYKCVYCKQFGKRELHGDSAFAVIVNVNAPFSLSGFSPSF